MRIDHLVVEIVRQRVGYRKQQPVRRRERRGKAAGRDQAGHNVGQARDFRGRQYDDVAAYGDLGELHERLAKGEAAQKQTSDAGKLNDAQNTLTARVQAARAGAKHGEFFTETIRPVFRRLLAPELKGQAGRDAKAVLKDDAPDPGSVPFKVNAKYPEGQPLPTVPANLLLTLPPLPAPLEYRIVGQHLLLLDTGADLVVDYILNAIST